MEIPPTPKSAQNEIKISKEDITEFAQASYKYESGTKKAIDEGRMTMKELTIYHYINAWTNHNMPSVEGSYSKEHDRVYEATLQKAFLVATQEYSISEKEAREIHHKVCHIPRVAR
jgi:hypothetical protein